MHTPSLDVAHLLLRIGDNNSPQGSYIDTCLIGHKVVRANEYKIFLSLWLKESIVDKLIIKK